MDLSKEGEMKLLQRRAKQDLFAYVDVVAVVVIVVTATIPFHVKAARSLLSSGMPKAPSPPPSVVGPPSAAVHSRSPQPPHQPLQPLVALNTLIGGLCGANLTPERTNDRLIGVNGCGIEDN